MSRRPTPLTSQQAAAITTRGVSIGLSAGAGCGKTFVLTERFLAYLEPREDADDRDPLAEIVAITFTDRAAREMRDRIRSACAQRLKVCPESAVPHWLSILRRIDAARISTIHSFCASFLRRHAVEARVDPQFRLLDAGTGDAFQRRSIAQTVRRLLETGDLDCMTLVFHYGLEHTQRTLQALLSGMAMIDPERFLNTEAPAFAAAWTESLAQSFVPATIHSLGRSPIVVDVLELLQANEPSHPLMQERRARLLEQLPRLQSRDNPAPLSLLEEIRESAQVKSGGNKNAWSSAETYEAVRDALTRLREAIDDIAVLAEFEMVDVELAASISVAAARVVRAVAADYTLAKNEAGVMDFDDLLLRTRDLLRESETVRRQAADSIVALLVDEFQDTDPAQAEIVRALASLGENAKSGRLFVVGDAKQSIYRFRGADPAVFDAMRRQIPVSGRLPLTTNFRSQPAILNFVNAVFAPTLGDSYERLVPHLRQVSPTPSIEFLFAKPNAGEEEADRVEYRRRREAEWLARRIAGLLNDDTPRIPEKNPETGDIELRRVRPGDVAVLFRALSDVAIYEDAFRRQGIDYYLVGGRAFFAQQEVYDFVNLCAFLNDPDDAVSLVGILRSPFFSFADDTLFALAECGPTLRESLDAAPPGDLPEGQQEQWKHASRVLNELLRVKDRLSLAALLQCAVDRTGYDASLLHEFLGRRKVANLRKLIEMARQFDRSGLGTLSDFAQQLRDSVTEEAPEEMAATHPETSAVVRLMTIHQSKGLEFPVVIVADMDRARRGSSRGAVYHREFGPLVPLPSIGDEDRRHVALDMHKQDEDREDELESVRILYVAMTRAADHLILSAGLDANGRPHSHWLKILAERFDLRTGLPKGDPYFGRLSTDAKSPSEIPTIHVHHDPPDAPLASRPRPKHVPLARYRELVEDGVPAVLPELMEPIPAKRSGRLSFSVSAIEQADAALCRGRASRPADTDVIDEAAPRDPENAALLGTVLHTVIERLDGSNATRFDAIVSAVLKSVPATDARSLSSETVMNRVRAFVESDVWADVSQATRSYREIDFILPWPVDRPVGGAHAPDGVIVTGKVDCLVETVDGRWKIIDYKTGRVPYGDPASILDHYAIQLVLYAYAVRVMIGRFPESIEVVTLHEQVSRYPLTLWPEFLARVSDRIDAAIRSLATDIA